MNERLLVIHVEKVNRVWSRRPKKFTEVRWGCRSRFFLETSGVGIQSLAINSDLCRRRELDGTVGFAVTGHD